MIKKEGFKDFVFTLVASFIIIAIYIITRDMLVNSNIDEETTKDYEIFCLYSILNLVCTLSVFMIISMTTYIRNKRHEFSNQQERLRKYYEELLIVWVRT